MSQWCQKGRQHCSTNKVHRQLRRFKLQANATIKVNTPIPIPLPHMVKMQLCYICGILIKHGNLSRHLGTHKIGKTHKCRTCKKSFFRQDNLKRHLKTHYWRCAICSSTFVNRFDINRHAEIEHRTFLITCDFCHRSFRPNTWLEHQKICKLR